MILLTVLAAWFALQIFGSGAPLQKDQWFFGLQKRLSIDAVRSLPAGTLLLSLALPVLALVLFITVLASILGTWVLFFIDLPVLLYSFGRGDFSQDLTRYLLAHNRNDQKDAREVLALQGQFDDELDELMLNEWQALHRQALLRFAYRGMERLFAVLFWYLLLGAAGALLYRLSHLYVQHHKHNCDSWHLAAKWLWMMEWPVVRVLGASWALVGNFAGCFSAWRDCAFCGVRSSSEVLMQCLQGALGLSSGDKIEVIRDGKACNLIGCSIEQVQALQPLLSRSLILWVSALAIWVILG